MVGRTHQIGGLATVMAANILYGGVHLNGPTTIIIIFAALIGSESPDLDQPTSILYRKIPAGTEIGKLVQPFFIGGHRHLSHSLIGLGIFAFISHYLIFRFLQFPGLHLNYIWAAYLIGVISHFILDGMTTEGIPLLYPLNFKFGLPPIRALRIKTGGAIESYIVFPLIVLSIFYLYMHYYFIFNK